jgi:hypothetical protein
VSGVFPQTLFQECIINGDCTFLGKYSIAPSPSLIVQCQDLPQVLSAPSGPMLAAILPTFRKPAVAMVLLPPYSSLPRTRCPTSLTTPRTRISVRHAARSPLRSHTPPEHAMVPRHSAPSLVHRLTPARLRTVARVRRTTPLWASPTVSIRV